MAQDAKMKPQQYVDPRPPEHFVRFHKHTQEHEPDWVYTLAYMIMAPLAMVLYWPRTTGRRENIPKHGAVILAPNHFSAMDHFLVACKLWWRRIRFMAKSQMFTWPMQWVYRHGGTFPVCRGQEDEEAMATARSILRRGHILTMYCEGGRQRSGTISDKAQRGIGRLALETGVPVIPTAIYGSQKARNWKRLRFFAKVRITYGPPLYLGRILEPTREQQQEAADKVLAAIRTLYFALAAQVAAS